MRVLSISSLFSLEKITPALFGSLNSKTIFSDEILLRISIKNFELKPISISLLATVKVYICI